MGKIPDKMGTCYKLSGKRNKPFIARAYVGCDECRKPIYKTIGYFKTKTEGLKALIEYNVNPYNVEGRKLTFREVYNMWREMKINEGAQPENMKNYNKSYNLLKEFKDMIFCEIKGYHLQKVIDELGKKYKISYLNRMYTLLTQLYKFAVINDICDKDYSKVITKKGISKEEQPYFTENEVIKIYNGIGKVDNADMLFVLCLTGVRPAELFNFSKFTVDLKRGIISGVGVKSGAGFNKRIPISKYIKPILAERYSKTDLYLFPMPNGDKMEYQHFLNKIYMPCLKALKIPYKPPKSARHFWSTYLRQNIKNEKIIISILGHSNIKITDDNYVHIDEKTLIRENEKIDNLLQDIF